MSIARTRPSLMDPVGDETLLVSGSFDMVVASLAREGQGRGAGEEKGGLRNRKDLR